jgi:type I restriction enzyme S subunit
LDENKYFLINRGELEDYLSPLFYAYQPTNIKNGKRLREIAEINPFRKKPKLKETDLVPYIGLPETDDLEIKQVLKRPISEVDGRNILLKKDILFARIEPSIFNKKYILANNLETSFAYTSTEFYIVKGKLLNDQKYIFYSLFTDIVFDQIKGKTTGSTGRRRLDRDVFEKTIIPYPDKGIRELVVKMMDNAVAIKQQKEQQAKELLNSIDDYLLNELGIQLPTPPVKTIQYRMFRASWQKVTGNRFDSLYHHGSIYGGVEKTKFPFEKLKQHVFYLKTGFAAGRNDQDYGRSGFIQIRPTNISEKRDLIFDKSIYIDPDTVANYKQEIIKSGEVLFNNTNSQELVGKSVYFNSKRNYFCSNHITRISVRDTVHPIYLTYLFNLYQRKQVFFKYCINWNNQSGVNNEFLRKLCIPVPDVATQGKIVAKLEAIMQNAFGLLLEAQQDFNQTRKEIERMILE